MMNFNNMIKKDKIQYIWDYYKIQIAIIIVVLIGLISFIHGQITKIDYKFNLTIIGNTLDEGTINQFQKQLSPIVIKSPTKKQSAQVDIMLTNSLTSQTEDASAPYMEKLIAEISANKIDLLLLDKIDYDFFQKQGMFLKLDNIQGLDLSSIKAENLEGALGKGVYGINIQDNKLLTTFGVTTKDYILCIPTSTKQKANGILAIKWILANS